MIKQILQRQFYRYVIVGASVYVIEVGSILVTEHMGASGVLAVAISFWIGLFLSFILQKFVSFGDKRMHHRVLLPQLVAVSLLVLFNFGFTIVMVKILTPRIPAVWARTVALAITTTWNFYLYRTRIFKTDNEPLY